jgi:hypothetical protein
LPQDRETLAERSHLYTDWYYSPCLRETRSNGPAWLDPNVNLNCDVLFVDDRDIVTSAETAAALNCCIHFIRRDLGAEIANRLLRRLVTAPHRSGGQAQFMSNLMLALLIVTAYIVRLSGH